MVRFSWFSPYLQHIHTFSRSPVKELSIFFFFFYPPPPLTFCERDETVLPLVFFFFFFFLCPDSLILFSEDL